MLRFLSPRPIGLEIDHLRRLGRRVRQGSLRRRARCPHVECLETRFTPAMMTWTGSVSGQWMTAGNWASGIAPQAGDDLVFPVTATNFNTVNNFPANTQFNSITIEAPDYSLTGNPIDVALGISATYTSGVSNDAINTDLLNGVVGVSTGGTLNLEGAISGSAGLNLSGGGTLGLSGTNNYTGTTVIGSSTLLVDSTIGAVQDSDGVLGGNGTVGNVTSVGGTISPGSTGSPSVLNTGSLSLDANSTFVTELDGNSPGNGASGYSQVAASGPVSLGGASLDVTLASGFVPTVGDQYTIISNNSGSISGTFAGLAQGDTDVISGYSFSVSYTAGSGESVALIALPFPTTTTISASAQSSTYGQSVTFTADVSGAHGPVAGQVAFFDGNPGAGGTLLGVADVIADGQASMSTTKLDVSGSPYQIYAEYGPSASSVYGSSTSTQPVSVTITPATINASLTGTVAKTYDGTTAATVSSNNFLLPGVINGDVVSVGAGPASYDTPDVGTGKTVTVTELSLTGADADNYVLGNTTASGPVGVITAAPLAVSGVTAQDKVYDGTTSATIDTTGATLSGVIAPDDVSLVTSGAVGSFADKNIGFGKLVSVSGLSLSGPDAGNYVISPFPSTTASITPAPLTVTANPATMTYGGTLPVLTDTVSGLVGADTVRSALTGSLATTATSGSPVGDYPITLGTLAAVNGNYTITLIGANVSITPAALTIAANDASKVYGAPIPVLTASYAGFVNGDTVASLKTPVSLTTSATSSSPVGVYGINVGGASSSNYTITYVPGTLTITKASASVASSVSVSTVVVGQTDTFTADVAPQSPGAGQPTGQVTFLVDGTPLATVPINPATGQASFSTSSVGLGSHSVMVTYAGDSSFGPSQSSSNPFAVSAASTQSVLTAQAVRNKRGKITKVILESQVVVVSPGIGVPTGVATYFRGSRRVAKVALVDGTASLRLKSNQALNKSFVVQYSGDADFGASTSSKVVPTKKSLKR